MPVTNYVWDPVDDNVVLETDNTNATTATYTHEPGRYGGLISQRRGATDSYYHYDGLGSTRELTNDSETVTDTNLYDAWGVNVDSSGTTENPYRWVGRSGYYYDTETEDYYVRARVYQPATGRWWSVDPILFVDGWNLFRYVFNRMVNRIDPSGLSSRADIATGDLVFTCNCGWIDWGHAGNAGGLWTRQLGYTAYRERLAKRSRQGPGKRNYLVTSKQGQSAPKTKIEIDTVRRSYFVQYGTSGLTEGERESIALGIWKEVSEAFEAHQHRLRQSSGFSVEDLPSDLIGLYREIDKYSRADIETMCGAVSIPTAQSIWDEGGGIYTRDSPNPWMETYWRPFYPQIDSNPFEQFNDPAGILKCFSLPKLNTLSVYGPASLTARCVCGSRPAWPEKLSRIPLAKKGVLWRDWKHCTRRVNAIEALGGNLPIPAGCDDVTYIIPDIGP